MRSIKDEFTQIASQTQVNKPLSNSEHSPSDDYIGLPKVQQPTLTRACAWTYERKLRAS